MACATQTTLFTIGPSPQFDPLEVEYGDFRHDQMQRIQEFEREKDDMLCTMYTRLTRFAIE